LNRTLQTHDAAQVAPGAMCLVGAENFRDLGGLAAEDGRRLRKGALLRSDRLCDLTHADWRVLAQAELATICDLRSNAERERHPNAVPETIRAKVLEFDIHNDLRADQRLVGRLSQMPTAAGAVEVMSGIYSDFPREFVAVLRVIRDHLLAGGTPLLIHCTAGKDRTGFVVAVLLRMLGIAPEQIEADYIASRGWLCSTRRRGAMARHLSESVPAPTMDAVLDAVLDARPSYLRAAFAALSHDFGSFERYVSDTIGVSDAQRDQLSLTLLD
jgi:protein-tyrosine phosphatase